MRVRLFMCVDGIFVPSEAKRPSEANTTRVRSAPLRRRGKGTRECGNCVCILVCNMGPAYRDMEFMTCCMEEFK